MRAPPPLTALITLFIAASPARAAPPSPDALGVRAEAEIARGAFEEAAATWEALAREAPSAAIAPQALADACVLRLQLDQMDRARADATTLDRAYAARRPDLITRVTLARARRLAAIEDWDALAELLRRAMPALERAGFLDDRLEAHALFGRALARLGRAGEADVAYRLALRVPPREALTARAADALGEARFHVAERERVIADRVVLAPYAGGGDRESVLAYHHGPAARWSERKRYAIEVAERAYLRVFGVNPPAPRPLTPPSGLLGGDPSAPAAPWGADDDALDAPRRGAVPSPRWAIAAASRVAVLWVGFAAVLGSVPIPRAWSHEVSSYDDLRAMFGHGGREPRRGLEAAREARLRHGDAAVARTRDHRRAHARL